MSLQSSVPIETLAAHFITDLYIDGYPSDMRGHMLGL